MLEPSFLVLPLLYHILLFIAIDGEFLEVPFIFLLGHSTILHVVFLIVFSMIALGYVLF